MGPWPRKQRHNGWVESISKIFSGLPGSGNGSGSEETPYASRIAKLDSEREWRAAGLAARRPAERMTFDSGQPKASPANVSGSTPAVVFSPAAASLPAAGASEC